MSTNDDKIEALRGILDPETPEGSVFQMVLNHQAAEAESTANLMDAMWAEDVALGMAREMLATAALNVFPNGGTTYEYERGVSLVEMILFPPDWLLRHCKPFGLEVVKGERRRHAPVPWPEKLTEMVEHMSGGRYVGSPA